MEKKGDVMLGVEDESGQPVSALSILSLLERVSTIIDGVQASQQRMEERQQQLESSVSAVQSELLKLTRDHGATATTVDKLLQKARRVSTHVKEVRSRVEKQNVRVKKVETTQDELLTRNKFRVVIYQVYRLIFTHIPNHQISACVWWVMNWPCDVKLTPVVLDIGGALFSGTATYFCGVSYKDILNDFQKDRNKERHRAVTNIGFEGGVSASIFKTVYQI